MKLKIVILVLLSLMFTGCLSPVKTLPVATYMISSLQLPSNPIRTASHASLLVSMPSSNPGYESSKMVYVEIPFNLRAFAENKWVAPPAQMLLPILAQSIRNRGYFRAVVTPPFVGLTHYRLSTDLITLQQEFFQPTSEVRLVIQATLVNQDTGKVVASQRFAVLEPAPANNPYSGVLATNRAVTEIAQKISHFVINSIK